MFEQSHLLIALVTYFVATASPAIIFSTAKAQRIYQKAANWFNGILALVFGVAGFKLLAIQNE